MSFTLLTGRTFYKQQVEKLDGYWDNGLYHDGEETITYPTFTGHYEPLDPEEAELLPTGVKTSAAIWVYTSEVLRTYSDYETDAVQDADVIFLVDPTSGSRKARPYKVQDSEVWETGDDFDMISDEHSYICIREDKK